MEGVEDTGWEVDLGQPGGPGHEGTGEARPGGRGLGRALEGGLLSSKTGKGASPFSAVWTHKPRGHKKHGLAQKR